MINADDIKSKLFKKQLSGYSIAEVDLFLSEVSADVDELNHQNAELLSKIDLLIERLDQYEQQEEQIKAAILNAQRMCDNMVADAQSCADLMRGAEICAEKIADGAEATTARKGRETMGYLQRQLPCRYGRAALFVNMGHGPRRGPCEGMGRKTQREEREIR